MQALKAYLNLIDVQLLQHVSGKPKWFIDLYRQQEYLSEEVFMNHICGDKYNESYYRKLKSQTIKILQSLAVVSNPKGNNLVKKKYEICQKYFLIAQKMLVKEQRMEGMRLIKDAYDIAVEYDFTHFAGELAGILYHNLAYFGEKNKKTKLDAKKYAEEMERYAYNYLAEKKAERHFYIIISETNRSAIPDLIQEAIKQISLCKGTSIRYQVILSTLNVQYGFHIGDYQLVIKNCTDALDTFRNKSGVYNSQYYSFLKELGVAQMAIGQYSEASDSFEQATQYIRFRSYNDYILRFYKAMNALRAGQYQEAYDLYQQNSKCRNEAIRQQFAIIEAYLHFMVYTGRLKLDKPFHIRKYLNDTFKAQADKRGDNISIVIAELLMYLAKDRGKFIDRVEAVKSYSYRYLKGEDTQRAKWFIRILCLLPRANFHPIALARLAKRQIENIQQSSGGKGQNFAIEVIPFENLLGMVVGELERRVA